MNIIKHEPPVPETTFDICGLSTKEMQILRALLGKVRGKINLPLYSAINMFIPEQPHLSISVKIDEVSKLTQFFDIIVG